nr:MAG TPA: hypothetical protein [Inoviridae sp.]DAW39116.1 MAG TPA: hypothetical protein [Inoviridae sp.]
MLKSSSVKLLKMYLSIKFRGRVKKSLLLFLF